MTECIEDSIGKALRYDDAMGQVQHGEGEDYENAIYKRWIQTTKS